MLAATRSAGVAPEMNLREHATHMPQPSVNMAAYSGFETQTGRHQKFKTEASVAPKAGFMSSNFFLKKAPWENVINKTLDPHVASISVHFRSNSDSAQRAVNGSVNIKELIHGTTL